MKFLRQKGNDKRREKRVKKDGKNKNTGNILSFSS
jgi:hypothetical protein